MKMPGDNDFGEITLQKISALRKKIAALSIDLSLAQEKFVKGGGKGGQKINKTNNAVMIKYPPLNIVVKCQQSRSRAVNRFLALRILAQEAERKMRLKNLNIKEEKNIDKGS